MPPPHRWCCCHAKLGLGWLTAALAPALGLAGLAGAFPALAGQRARLAERAALAALGYWWLILAEPLLDRRLWLGVPAGTPARAVWEGSLSSAATHVVGPSLSLGVLYGAAVWALAAVLLPWVVRGRSAVLDVVAASAWSLALLLACSPRYVGLYGVTSCPQPRAARSSARCSAARSRWPPARCVGPSEDVRHALRRDLLGTVRSHRGGSLKWAVPARGRTSSTPPMNPLKSLETTIASLVEGGFGRLFRTEVRPMELARKLAREMDEHRTASVSRVYAPNEYSVWLSPAGPSPLRRSRARGDRRAVRLSARARAP